MFPLTLLPFQTIHWYWFLWNTSPQILVSVFWLFFFFLLFFLLFAFYSMQNNTGILSLLATFQSYGVTYILPASPYLPTKLKKRLLMIACKCASQSQTNSSYLLSKTTIVHMKCWRCLSSQNKSHVLYHKKRSLYLKNDHFLCIHKSSWLIGCSLSITSLFFNVDNISKSVVYQGNFVICH